MGILNPHNRPVCEEMYRTEAAHVGQRGLSQKCSDRETIPLCAFHHRTGPESHHRLGKLFWKHHGLDRYELIRELQSQFDMLATRSRDLQGKAGRSLPEGVER